MYRDPNAATDTSAPATPANDNATPRAPDDTALPWEAPWTPADALCAEPVS